MVGGFFSEVSGRFSWAGKAALKQRVVKLREAFLQSQMHFAKHSTRASLPHSGPQR